MWDMNAKLFKVSYVLIWYECDLLVANIPEWDFGIPFRKQAFLAKFRYMFDIFAIRLNGLSKQANYRGGSLESEGVKNLNKVLSGFEKLYCKNEEN